MPLGHQVFVISTRRRGLCPGQGLLTTLVIRFDTENWFLVSHLECRRRKKPFRQGTASWRLAFSLLCMNPAKYLS